MEKSNSEEKLMQAISQFDMGEQEAIWGLLQRVLSVETSRSKTALDLVHSMFMPDPDVNPGQVALTSKAPKMFKEYSGIPRISLPDEWVPMEHTYDEVLQARAARRNFFDQGIPLDVFSTFLYRTAGVKKHIVGYNSGEFPVRFTPSGGGLQPWEVYVISNNIDGIQQGLYHYSAKDHSLVQLQLGQMRDKVSEIGFGTEFLHYSNFVCCVTCVPSRFMWKYGLRGYRIAHFDVGVLIQAMWLAATALKLRSLPLSGFREDTLVEFLGVDSQEEFPMIMFAVGTRMNRKNE